MKAQRILIATAIATTLTGAVIGFGGSTASASPAYSCNSGPTECTGSAGGATFYPANGNPGRALANGTALKVSCWYPGGPGDGLWDHVEQINSESADGHVADSHINFGGYTASELGLPRCG